MLLDFSKLPAREVYGWMTSAIAPRPIAWVSTIAADGRTNLAPFSFFQGVTSNPPTLMFVPVNNRAGEPKDTVRNIREVPEFVVHVVPYALADPMNASAATLPHGDSEFEKFAIATVPAAMVRPPRIAAAPVAFECTLHQIVEIGEGPLAAHVVFGRIQRRRARRRRADRRCQARSHRPAERRLVLPHHGAIHGETPGLTLAGDE
jgi:flavin reductase (DIM6/NTAB) family NADH-FMN oxidoreductase RutF